MCPRAPSPPPLLSSLPLGSCLPYRSIKENDRLAKEKYRFALEKCRLSSDKYRYGKEFYTFGVSQDTVQVYSKNVLK